MKTILVLCTIIVFTLLSCTSTTPQNDSTAMEPDDNSNLVDFNPDRYKNEDIIFYNLFSPVDLTYLVSKDVSFYNSSLLNPLNNITNYHESSKVALNLGIYGADLSYLWLFDQTQQAHSYLTAIQQLSDQLDIPREFVDFTYANAQSHSNELDTLIDIARKSYYTAENYLKETDRNYAASMILLGGWIETLYIALNMYELPNQKIISRLAIQKYSSNSLVKLLQNSQNQSNTSEYLLLIKKLNTAFDELNIQYPEGSLVIDTINHRISVANNADIKLSNSQIEELRQITMQIRNYIIE